MHNHRYWVAASALALLLGSTGADATTLDKLTGQSLTVGNLLFSNIQARSIPDSRATTCRTRCR